MMFSQTCAGKERAEAGIGSEENAPEAEAASVQKSGRRCRTIALFFFRSEHKDMCALSIRLRTESNILGRTPNKRFV